MRRRPAEINGWTIDAEKKQVVNKLTGLVLTHERMQVVGKWLLQVASWMNYDGREREPKGGI